MGIVFGVCRNWIWKFGDLKSDIHSPILWGSISPNTIISNLIRSYIYIFSLDSIVFSTKIWNAFRPSETHLDHLTEHPKQGEKCQNAQVGIIIYRLQRQTKNLNASRP